MAANAAEGAGIAGDGGNARGGAAVQGSATKGGGATACGCAVAGGGGTAAGNATDGACFTARGKATTKKGGGGTPNTDRSCSRVWNWLGIGIPADICDMPTTGSSISETEPKLSPSPKGGSFIGKRM